jgi:arylsulfatase A-like enzyme
MHVWGVRQGDWKLVKENIRKDSGAKGDAAKIGLYFLADDITESNDLSGKMPEKRKELQAIYDAWTTDLPPSPTEGKAPRSRPPRERPNRAGRAER